MLRFMGSQRVGHDLSDLAAAEAAAGKGRKDTLGYNWFGSNIQFSSVQSLSRVPLFATP